MVGCLANPVFPAEFLYLLFTTKAWENVCPSISRHRQTPFCNEYTYPRSDFIGRVLPTKQSEKHSVFYPAEKFGEFLIFG